MNLLHVQDSYIHIQYKYNCTYPMTLTRAQSSEPTGGLTIEDIIMLIMLEHNNDVCKKKFTQFITDTTPLIQVCIITMYLILSFTS